MIESLSTAAAQEFKFVLDRLGDTDDGGSTGLKKNYEGEFVIDTLNVPQGQSFLYMPPGQAPRIVSADEHAAAAKAGALVAGKTFALEPFRQDHQYMLMLVSSADQPLMLNGQPAPMLAVLGEGDQIRDEQGDHVLHVTYYLKPYVGAPSAAMIASAQECGLCRLPLVEGTQVYVCPFCRGATHLETPEHKAGAKPLQCAASTTTCPHCSNPIVKDEGLTYVPREVLEAVQHG